MQSYPRPCVIHPSVTASAACARCMQPYCDNCLVEFLGARYCGPCRNLKLAETQGSAYLTGYSGFPAGRPIYEGTGRVDVTRWLTRGWEMLFAETGTWVLATLITMLLGTLSCGLVMPALLCGMHMMALRQVRGERPALDHLFGGFRRFGSALLLMLIPGLPVTLLFGLAYGNLIWAAMSSPSSESSRAMTAMLLFYAAYPVMALINLAFYTIGFFASTRIAAVGGSPLAALSDSWQVVQRNRWGFLGLVVLLGLIYMLGGSFCAVLLLFVLPLLVLTGAQAYVDHFGLDDAELG